MNLSNYYYHTILKDYLSKEELYKNLELILQDGYIKSKKLLDENSQNTYNGSEYISIASYQEPSVYKVLYLDQASFKTSYLSKKYSYEEYLNLLKEDEYLEKPLTKEEYFSKYNTINKRDYFNYLDKITKTYPVDIKVLYNKTKDPIYQEILTLIDNDILMCYPSENAFQKFVLDTKGITFIFPNTLSIENVSIIPNLPFEIEAKLVKIISTKSTRYSNLIGEVQVKDKISLKDSVGLIIKDNLDKKLIKNLLKKYNYNLKIYYIENNTLIKEDN